MSSLDNKTGINNKLLQLVRHIDQTILESPLRLEIGLQAILEGALSLIDAEYGNITIIERGYLVVKVTTNPNKDVIGTQLLLEDSVSGMAVGQKKPTIVSDVRQEPKYKKVISQEMRSELAVPMIINDRVIGVINVESPQINAFQADDSELLQILANQAAIAIRNARYLREVQALRQIDQAILSSTTDLEQTLDIVLRKCTEIIGVIYGSILFVEGNELIVKAVSEQERNYRNIRVQIGNSVTGRAARQKETVIVPDISQEPEYQKISHERETQSEIAVPLISEDRAIGVLNIESTRLNAFSEHDKYLLEVLAGQLVIAIEFARNHQNLSILRRIDYSIQEAGNELTLVLQAILNGALELINAKHGNIQLITGNELVVRATTTFPSENEIGLRLRLNETITGYSALKKEIIILSNVEGDHRYRRILKTEHMKSAIIVPMIIDERTIGVINIESPAENTFDEYEAKILETLAAQTAIAIRNAETNEVLKTLREIDKLILNPNLRLDDILQEILEKCLGIIDAQYGNLLLLKGNQLEIRATSASEVDLIGERVFLDKSVTGLAALKKRPIIVPDTDKELLYRRVLTSEYMRSELAAPLLDNGNVLGVINIESPRLDAFTLEEQALLELLAGQAAIAIRTARSILELQALRSIDRAILSTETTLDQALQTIVKRTKELVHVNYVNISLVEGDELIIRASTLDLDSTEDVLSDRVKVASSVTGKAVLEKQTVIVKDVGEEPLYKQVFNSAKMKSEMAVPLINEYDQVVGTINLESPVINNFTAHDEELVKTMASLAALAIQNNNFSEELQKARIFKAMRKTADWLVHRIGNLALNLRWPAERLERFVADNESALEDLQMIRSASEQLVQIKKDLLRPLRQPKLEPLKLQDVIHRSAKDLNIPETMFSLNVLPDVPAIIADENDLYDVFTELFENALEAMEERANKSLSVNISVDHRNIEVRIRDNGHGIPLDKLEEEIWALGYTTRPKGTGLGLYQCSQIMHNMDAIIDIESEIDIGTIIIIKFPVAKFVKKENKDS